MSKRRHTRSPLAWVLVSGMQRTGGHAAHVRDSSPSRNSRSSGEAGLLRYLCCLLTLKVVFIGASVNTLLAEYRKCRERCLADGSFVRPPREALTAGERPLVYYGVFGRGLQALASEW